MSVPILSLRNLSFSYTANEPVLACINLDIFPGQTFAIFGKNGAGKTTLFRCITGLEKISGGEILLYGESIRKEKDYVKLRKNVGYVMQNSEDQIIFPKVLEDICFGPLNAGLSLEEARSLAGKILADLGIAELENRSCAELSGGEQKLVALAGILVQKPALLLLDEPFNGLDRLNTKLLLDILQGLSCAKIIISHSQELTSALEPVNLNLAQGKLEPSSHAHGQNVRPEIEDAAKNKADQKYYFLPRASGTNGS